MKNTLFLFIVLFSGMSYSQSQKEETNQKYTQLIELADSCLLNKNYEKALIYYENALMYKCTESYPMQKISEIVVILKKQKQIKEHLQSADSCFNNKAFVLAKEHYIKVLEITPHNDYSKKKILEIDSILMTEEKLRK